MALSKSSKKFDMDEGLFEEPVREPVTSVETYMTKPLSETVPQEMKKTKETHRLSVTFENDVFRYVSIESRRRGMSITKFINAVMREYKASPNGRAEIEDWY